MMVLLKSAQRYNIPVGMQKNYFQRIDYYGIMAVEKLFFRRLSLRLGEIATGKDLRSFKNFVSLVLLKSGFKLPTFNLQH